MTKFDLYDREDRKKIITNPCPFCYDKEVLVFSGSSGYGSRFSDSSFVCINCKTTFSVGPLLPCQTFKECVMKMNIQARKHRDYLLRRIKDNENQVMIWKNQLFLWQSKKRKYNPSRRTKE